jgi:hypothetical protein
MNALESKHSETVSTSAKWITILQLPEKLFCCCTRTSKVLNIDLLMMPSDSMEGTVVMEDGNYVQNCTVSQSNSVYNKKFWEELITYFPLR